MRVKTMILNYACKIFPKANLNLKLKHFIYVHFFKDSTKIKLRLVYITFNANYMYIKSRKKVFSY